MKKLIITFFILIASLAASYAQCTPDSLAVSPGIHPDSATGLPHATVGVPYSTVMTAVIPHDTANMPFDSVGILSISGLPSGFTYAPNSPTGYWDGGPIGGVNRGCIVITGTALPGEVGSHPLTMQLKAYVLGFPYPYTDTDYKLIVDNSSGVHEIIPVKLLIYQNNPNPFNDKTNIVFSSPTKSNYTFTVSDMIGKVIYTEVISAKEGSNTISFSGANYKAGLYFYKLTNGKESITKKMTIY